MATALAPNKPTSSAIEQVLITGDLSKVTPEQRLSYYNEVCASLGLNPLTKPFAYLPLNGKLILYALKDATEQLRKLHGVSITEVTSSRLEDVFVVTAKAQDKAGRTDAATGAVAIGNLKGEALANALMKAETKAKRRATLSICGLGMLDETEAETLIPEPILPKVERVTLPAGSFQILDVLKTGPYSADVTYVDSAGVEDVLPMPLDGKEAALSVVEKFQQDKTPVLIERVVGVRDKKRKIKAVHAFEAQPAPPITAAEIFKSEDVGQL